MVQNPTKLVSELYDKYIKGTEEKAIVVEQKVLFCHLTMAVFRGCDIGTRKVHINTRVIKHLFDKKPAEEFHAIVTNAYVIVRYPDEVYTNRSGKRGDICFVKKVKDKKYLCSLEILKVDRDNQEFIEAHIVTIFRVRTNDYLKKYELLWKWQE